MNYKRLFLIFNFLILILPNTFAFKFLSDFDIVKKNNKYGVILSNKEVLIPFEYEVIREIHTIGFEVEKNSSKGFYSFSGIEVLPPIYTSLEFSDGYIIAQKLNSYFVFDLAGLPISKEPYSKIIPTDIPLFYIFSKNNISSFVGLSESKTNILFSFNEIKKIKNEPFLIVKSNSQQGVINLTGSFLIPFGVYDQITHLSGSNFEVKKNGKVGMFSIYRNSFLIPMEYEAIKAISHYSHKTFYTIELNKKIGIYDGDKIKTDLIFDSYSKLETKRSSIYSFVSEKGQYLFSISENRASFCDYPIQSYSLVDFKENIVVKEKDRVGLIDTDSIVAQIAWINGYQKILIKNVFFVAQNEKSQVIINQKGEVFENTVSDKIRYLSDKFFLAERNSKVFVGHLGPKVLISDVAFNKVELLDKKGYFKCDGQKYLWAQGQLFSEKSRKVSINSDANIVESSNGTFALKLESRSVIIDKDSNIIIDNNCQSVWNYNYEYYICENNKNINYVYDVFGNLLYESNYLVYPQGYMHVTNIVSDNKGNVGFYNRETNKFLISPIYKEIIEENDFCLGFKTNKSGYATVIDKTTFKIVMDSAKLVYPRFSIVKRNSDFFYLKKNQNGDLFYKIKNPKPIGDKYLIFEYNNSKTLVTDEHKILASEIDSAYVNFFSSREIVVKSTNGKYGLFDTEKMLIPYVHKSININWYTQGILTNDNNEVFLFKNDYGLIKKTKTILSPKDKIEFNFNYSRDYPNFLRNGKIGLINYYGLEILKNKYDSIVVNTLTKQGLLSTIKEKEKKGLLINGKMVLKPIYNTIEINHQYGLAFVKTNSKWQIFDLKTKILYPNQYDSIKGLYYNSVLANNTKVYLIKNSLK